MLTTNTRRLLPLVSGAPRGKCKSRFARLLACQRPWPRSLDRHIDTLNSELGLLVGFSCAAAAAAQSKQRPRSGQLLSAGPDPLCLLAPFRLLTLLQSCASFINRTFNNWLAGCCFTRRTHEWGRREGGSSLERRLQRESDCWTAGPAGCIACATGPSSPGAGLASLSGLVYTYAAGLSARLCAIVWFRPRPLGRTKSSRSAQHDAPTSFARFQFKCCHPVHLCLCLCLCWDLSRAERDDRRTRAARLHAADARVGAASGRFGAERRGPEGRSDRRWRRPFASARVCVCELDAASFRAINNGQALRRRRRGRKCRLQS